MLTGKSFEYIKGIGWTNASRLVDLSVPFCIVPPIKRK